MTVWDWASDIPIFRWAKKPDVKTTPLVCIFGCSDPVSAVAYFPHGCTCHPNKYQTRCYHHMMRAYDTSEEFVIVEDFTPDDWRKKCDVIIDESRRRFDRAIRQAMDGN